MSDEKRYAAPASDLYEPGETGQYGSIEKALAGDYELSIGNVLSEAWAATNGKKMLLNGALSVYFLILLVYAGITAAITYTFGSPEGAPGTTASLLTLPLDLAFYAVSGVITTGLYVLGAKISMGVDGGISELFRFSNRAVKSLLTYILMMIMIALGFLLLILPGIYLLVAYFPAIPLALEKDMSPWQALETSRKAVSKKWFSMFGLLIVMVLLMFLSLLTLGIALIWVAPMMCIAYGIVYRNIFGLEPETLAS